MHAPTSLDEAHDALKRAQAGHAEAIRMRPKTEQNVKEAKKLLQENHLATRIRESYQ